MTDLLKVKDLIQQAIDRGATTVEQIHQIVAALPFDILSQIEPLEETARTAKSLHQQSIGRVYDVIRRVNETVGKLAGEMLASAE